MAGGGAVRGGGDDGGCAGQAAELARLNLSASLDLFGERVTDPAVADAVAEAYRRLADRLAEAPPGTWLSVDLSHLGLTDDAGAARRRLASIAERLPDGARLQVGAEEAAVADAVLGAVHSVPEPRRLTATIQANLRRSPGDVPRLAEAGIGVRLVKGAYLEAASEAFPFGEATDSPTSGSPSSSPSWRPTSSSRPTTVSSARRAGGCSHAPRSRCCSASAARRHARSPPRG